MPLPLLAGAIGKGLLGGAKTVGEREGNARNGIDGPYLREMAKK